MLPFNWKQELHSHTHYTQAFCNSLDEKGKCKRKCHEKSEMEKTDLVPILNRGIEYFLVLFKSLQKMRLLSVILLEENQLLTAMILRPRQSLLL